MLIHGNVLANQLFGGGFSDTIYGYGDNDTLYGASNNDLLYGGSGNDRLFGDAGADTVYGGTGDDYIGFEARTLFGQKGEGNDRLYGDGGNDFIMGGLGNDRIWGGDGNDTLYGGEPLDIADDDYLGFSNILYGGAGNDQAFGSRGNDILYGGEGRDSLYGREGDDTFVLDDMDRTLLAGEIYSGGAGTDKLLLRSTLNGALFDLRAAQITSVEVLEFRVDGVLSKTVLMTVAQLNGFQTIVGSNVTGAQERIVASMSEAGTVVLSTKTFQNWGAQGDHIVVLGSAGNDSVSGSAFSDDLSGADGNDSLRGGAGADTLRGDGGYDLLDGGDGDDVLFGGGGNDTLTGGAGRDTVFGGSGHDQIVVGQGVAPGGSIIDGGADIDSLLIATSIGGAYDLRQATIRSIEVIEFASGFASARSLMLSAAHFGPGGFSPYLEIRGVNSAGAIEQVEIHMGGQATLDLSRLSLVNWGWQGEILSVFGDLGAERVKGSASGEVMTGGGGNDRLSGNRGDDTLSGDEGNDRLWGGGGNDQLSGGAGRDRLDGGNGNDTLVGGNGNDTITGGMGRDVMTGGVGRDVFTFDVPAQSRTGGGRDVIVDFATGIDKIDLSAFAAGFAFIGPEAFTGVAGQVRFSAGGLVLVDIDGDRRADMAIELQNGATIEAGDFIF